jgi:transposase-like protein
MKAYLPGSTHRKQTTDSKQTIVDFFANSGQQFLPILELLVDAKEQLHDFAHSVGTAAIEGLLELSINELCGLPHPGKKSQVTTAGRVGVRRHGHQDGVVVMGKSKLRVKRPRLRTIPDEAGKTSEVPPPAYVAMQSDPKLAERVMELSLGSGVSTRKYKRTLEHTSDCVGVSKSQVSRELKKAMNNALEKLQARVIPGNEILAVYVDGFVVGDTHVIGAIGVKKDGCKMVLGVREGASENLTVVTELLADLRDRGLNTDVPRLFVLDGGKALRSAVDGVFGTNVAVQRCRNHKIRNVLDHLPEKQRMHAKLVMRAAFNLEDAGKGIEKLRQYASDLERSGWSSAAGSLREGLVELFTVQALGLPGALGRCLATTNLLDAAHSGTRGLLRRVGRWRDGAMAQRWVAASMLETEKSFRKVQGYKQLWMLEANLKARLDRQAADPIATRCIAA